jgi:hypothetical protein
MRKNSHQVALSTLGTSLTMKVSMDHLPITWTADAISKEFGIPQATVYRRLKAADIDLKGEISTRDALRAVFKEGTYTAERLRLARAQADKCEIEVAQLRGEYEERSYVTRIISADGSFKYEPLSPEVVAHLRA